MVTMMTTTDTLTSPNQLYYCFCCYNKGATMVTMTTTIDTTTSTNQPYYCSYCYKDTATMAVMITTTDIATSPNQLYYCFCIGAVMTNCHNGHHGNYYRHRN